MGYVKRRASTKAKENTDDFEAVKAQVWSDIKSVVEMEEIPYNLIVNWGQTSMFIIPVGSWNMEKKGGK